MASETKSDSTARPVRVFLPWLIAACAAVLYLLTLNRWVSFGNLDQVASVSGWNWYPQLFAPLNYILTLPIHWLPSKYIPLALNLFAALCATLTLLLLARSVTLLPHDRTQDQREKERGPFWLLSIPTAWLPPVIAVLACGLELTFWEYATSANTVAPPWGGGTEMLDVLLFAYVIRCLLEFRVDPRESWLFRAALVFGAGMANNWAMIGFLPLFAIALIWIRRLGFLNTRFLLRMCLLGLAGMSLYLVLPLVQNSAELARVAFWPALKIILKGQFFVLNKLFTKFNFFYADRPLWIMGLYSLLPVLAIGIKWPSYFGDTSKLGVSIATFATHLVHGILLLLCAWVFLDPPVSPRMHAHGLPFLTLYYLAGLSLGYFVGYFLLVFKPPPASPRREHPFVRLVRGAVLLCVFIVCVFVPVALVYKNLPQIRFTNGTAFAQFASQLAHGLPQRDTVVISDDRRRLLFLQSFAARTGSDKNRIFLDTSLFRIPDYHRYLKKKYGQRWPTNPPKETQSLFGPIILSTILYGLSVSNELYYLHPSFGYFFELFDPEPHGMVYKLTSSSTNAMTVPLPSPALVAENEKFWDEANQRLFESLTNAITPVPARSKLGFLGRSLKSLHVSREPNREAMALAQYYSRALDYWGVELQRAGDVEKAGLYFERAFQLNPGNLVASINLRCNAALQAGRRLEVRDPQAIMDDFGSYSGWDDIMGDNGPFDEPSFCYAQGCQMAANSLYRQAIQQLERVAALVPNHLQARLLLANFYTRKGLPEEGLKILSHIQERPDLFPIGRAHENEMLFVESSARLANNDVAGAEAAINRTLSKYPNDQELLGTAVEVLMSNGRFTNALPLIEREMQLNPTNSSLLLTNGFANIQAGRYEEAIPPLTRLLSVDTNSASEVHNTALLNRAIAFLKSGKLEEARRDYEELQKTFPTAYRIYFGLGEIAYQRRETNVALRNYQLYLTNAAPNQDEINLVLARIKELKPGYP